jgi:cell division protein FtsQ
MRTAKLVGVILLVGGLLGFIEHEIEVRLPPIKIASLPIKYVRTEGVFQYLSKDDVRMVLQPLVTTNFFEADMQAIQQAVSELPWVETVTVKRVWPEAIAIKVTEKKPFVRWHDNSLMTEQGVIFTPKNIADFTNLTRLSGPDRQQVKVLEMMKGIKTTLADQSKELTEFSVNDRGAWTIKLSTGLQLLLGRNEQLKKLQRFLKTLILLKQEQIDAMATVDLRYPNGYAVSWQSATPEFDWQSIYAIDNIATLENEINKHTR